MPTDPQRQITSLDPRQPTARTESGELERPAPLRRRIDCGGSQEVADRRGARAGGRRASDREEYGTA